LNITLREAVSLHEKNKDSSLKNMLSEYKIYFQTACAVLQEYLHHVIEKPFGILLMGSSCVGKSALINYILKKDAAKTNARHNACTTEVEFYEYQETYTLSTKERRTTISASSIRILNAPDIEDWTQVNLAKHVRN